MKDENEKTIDFSRLIQKKIKKYVFIKISLTVFLSFISLIILIIWYFLRNNDLNSIKEIYTDFIQNGGLIILAISSLSTLIANLGLDKLYFKTKNENYSYIKQGKRRSKSIDNAEWIITSISSITLFILGLTYTALISNGINNRLIWGQGFMYIFSIIILFNYNYFKELANPSKYYDLHVELSEEQNELIKSTDNKEIGEYNF